MKNIAIIIFLILVFSVLLLSLISFQVSESEAALRLTFGSADEPITAPGWYFKWPVPIQDVKKFDTRNRVLDSEISQIPTKGAIPIIVHSYITWRVENPLEYHNSFVTEDDAAYQMRSRLSGTENNIIGRYDFSDFVNSDASKVKIKQIEQEMFDDLRNSIADAGYGIEVTSLGIKKLKISADVSKKVFEQMIAERASKTIQIVTEGEAQAMKIKSDADAKRKILLAAANARATNIRGQGDYEAAKYYEMLKVAPEFALYLMDIEALKDILPNRSTFVVPTDVQPFRLLKEIPELEKTNN